MSRNLWCGRGFFTIGAAVLWLAAGAIAAVPPEFIQVGPTAAEIDFDDVLVAINCGNATYAVKGVTFYHWNEAALIVTTNRSASNLTDPGWNGAWPNPFTAPELGQLDEIYKSIGYWDQTLWVEFKGLSTREKYKLQTLWTANQANTWDHGGSFKVIGAAETVVFSNVHLNTFARGIPFVVTVEDIAPSANGVIRIEYYREAGWVCAPACDGNKIWSGIILSGPARPPIAWPTDLAAAKAGNTLTVSWVNHEPSTNGAPYDEIRVFADGIQRTVLGEGAPTIDEAKDNKALIDLSDPANAALAQGVHLFEIRVDAAGYVNSFSTRIGLAPVRVALGPYAAFPVVTSDGREWQSDAGIVTGDRNMVDWQANVDPVGQPVDGIPNLDEFGLDPLDPVDQSLFSHFNYDSGGGGTRNNHLGASFGIPNGTYEVRLYFWEFASPWAMDRTGQAVIEGSAPTYFAYGDAEDTYAVLPPNAWMLEFPAVEVKDGRLNVDLLTGWGANGDVTLSALEVLDADPAAKSIANFKAVQTDLETYELTWDLPEGADFDMINVLSRMSGQRETIDPTATSYTFTQTMPYPSTANEAFVIQARKGNTFYPMLHAGAGSTPIRINAGGAGNVYGGQYVSNVITARGLEWVSDLSYVDPRRDFVAPLVSGDLNYVQWGSAFSVQPGSRAETLVPPFANPAGLQGGDLQLLQQIRWCEGYPANDVMQLMDWEVPINDGTYYVRLYFGEGCCVRADDVSVEGSDRVRVYYNGLAAGDTVPVGIDFAMGATGRVTLAEFDGVEVSDGFLSISLDPFCAQGQPYDSNATISAIEILEWQPAPIVTSVEPSQGSTLGGTAVTITGQNFQAGAAVRFGGVPAADVVVKAQTEISCKTPAHAAGAVAVEVKNPDGQSASLPDAFTYFIAFLRGDTDGNGQFIINDGIQILERLFAGREAFDSNCEATGDLDDNGQLIINDAIWLFNFLFASGPEPAAPYPKCGLDPTPDDLGCDAYPVRNCP